MSSLIRNILIGALAVLLGLVCTMGMIAHMKSEALAKLKADKALVDQQVLELQTSVKTQQVVAKTTDVVVTKAAEETAKTTTKVVEANKKVDKITKQVADEKISTADADAAYLDSMWDTYCEAQPAVDRCTSRQPTP